MAKFANNTLTQVAGFDGQILAQELVYDQKDFWNMTWRTKVGTTFTPINLTDVDINAQIIRREISDITDGRYGLEFTISDYSGIEWQSLNCDVVSGNSSTDIIAITNANLLSVGDPVRFSQNLGTTIYTDTTYYVVYNNNTNNIKISQTLGGSVMGISTFGAGGEVLISAIVPPTPIVLTISNIVANLGKFTLEFDDDTWDVMASDPELNINATDPACFSGRIKLSFPAADGNPAYDEVVFLLFLIRSDGVVN